MPFEPFAIKPGVDTQSTALLGGNSWQSSNLIRFKDGLLQKLGGWLRLTSERFIGICRGLHPFVDLRGVAYIGIGTSERLQIFSVGHIYDITPIRATSDILTPFSTTITSPIVTVHDSSVVVAAGDWVYIVTLSYIGGILLYGYYQVVSVVSGGYTIDSGTAATSTVNPGGNVLSFTTTNTSHDVAITLGAYAFTNGQTITVEPDTAVDGLTVGGDYIVTVSGGPTYTIQDLLAATSAATVSANGGNVRIEYLLATAQETGNQGTSPYGLGPYGLGPYGTSNQTIYTHPLRQWSLDNWGEDLLACPTNGGIYIWMPPIALGNVATLITQAPAQNTGMFVAMPQRQIIAFGCTDPITGDQDPMLIRWCDVDDYTDWTASTTNQAGSFRIPRGSRIVGGLQGPGYALIWTDLDLWMMQYVGYPFVYSIRQVGWSCGLYSMRSAAQIGPNAYWLSLNGFKQFDGQAVTPLRCTVWDQLFNNMDQSYPDATFLGGNTHFNEFFVWYPTTGSLGVCTDYVKFNYFDTPWDFGVDDLQRSAWMDQSAITNPAGADYAGLLQQHETSPNADGAAMNSYAISGWLGTPNGTYFTYIQRVLPDFKLSGGAEMQLTFYTVEYVGDTPTTYGPFTVTATTQLANIEARGRYIMCKVGSIDLGSFWRLGKIEFEVTIAGAQ